MSLYQNQHLYGVEYLNSFEVERHFFLIFFNLNIKVVSSFFFVSNLLCHSATPLERRKKVKLVLR